jgi:integrase
VTSIKLRYVDCFSDRHGRVRYYFRRGRGARVALVGKPGTPEFMAAYQSALEGVPLERQLPKRGEPGTFDRLVQDYFESPDFLNLAPRSQYAYRRLIERLLSDEKIGHRLVSQMTRQHIQRIIGRRASTPGSANDTLRMVKILVHFAIDNGWRRDDPTVRVKGFALGEYHTWTNEEIAAYEQRWAIGSRERTAFALLLFTGQRVSDVAPMSWRDVEDSAIQVRQSKTGTKLWIPLHPELARTLEKWPKSEVVILRTAYGKSFTDKRLGFFMAAAIEAAGLPVRCVAHGLRKAAARRLAEAGCSANEIAAITGHASLNEVTRYTKAAEQKKLAKAAIGRIEKQDANKDSQT